MVEIVKDNKNQPVDLLSRRLCMVVHAFYPIGETRVEREALVLLDHGWDVDVICLQDRSEAPHETIDGINIYRLPIFRHLDKRLLAQLLEYLVFFALATVKLLKLHFHRRYNVIQVHNLPDWLVFVGLIPKLTGARLILDLHDLMPEFYAARFKRPFNSWQVKLLIWVEKISCLFADHVITVTEGWRGALIKRGLAVSKASVVMNVADNRVFYHSDSNEQSSCQNSHFRLLYHGNLTYRYGIDLAIHAVDLVRDQIPNIHLHIHGWGDSRFSLEKLTDELGLREHVSFNTTTLLTSELPIMISQADICLVPYRRDVFTDGILPTKLMEYAAMGSAVVAARTPMISNYFDETMVQFFTPDDMQDLARCLHILYFNHERLVKIRQGIEKFTQRYTWTDQGAFYVSLVERLALSKSSAKHKGN
jgi:glycosyltransferase involved in cell wall biosynthesis